MSDSRNDGGRTLGNGTSTPAATAPRPREESAAAALAPRQREEHAAAPPARRAADVACPYLRALLKRQARELPRIVDELEARGRKTSHWAWWAFPTDLCGASEPPPETKVSSPAMAAELLARGPVRDWRRVLELVCDLSEKRGELVCPSIDHGRVAFFVAFWERRDAASLRCRRDAPASLVASHAGSTARRTGSAPC
jgi:hypothetical protein